MHHFSRGERHVTPLFATILVTNQIHFAWFFVVKSWSDRGIRSWCCCGCFCGCFCPPSPELLGSLAAVKGAGFYPAWRSHGAAALYRRETLSAVRVAGCCCLWPRPLKRPGPDAGAAQLFPPMQPGADRVPATDDQRGRKGRWMDAPRGAHGEADDGGDGWGWWGVVCPAAPAHGFRCGAGGTGGGAGVPAEVGGRGRSRDRDTPGGRV